MDAFDLPTAFAAAWNAHDMHALATLFDEDARFVNVVGMFWKSRAEIEAAHRATHQTIFRDSRLSILDTQGHRLGEGYVALHARWHLSGLKGPDEAEAEREGILLFIAHERREGWSIAVAQNTDIVEGMLAPPPSH